MNEIDQIYNKLLSDPPTSEDLKMVESRAKIDRIGLASFLISNKVKILKIFSLASTIDHQLIIISILLKTLSKRQIQSCKFFDNFTAGFSNINKTSKNEIKEFIIKYTASIETARDKVKEGVKLNTVFPIVQGCKIRRFTSKFKSIELSEGYLFINKDCIKIFGTKDIIVIYYKSIMNIKIVEKFKWEIIASGEKNVEIEFCGNERGYVNIKSRMMDMFNNQLETENSFSFSINFDAENELVKEPRVSFNSESNIIRLSRIPESENVINKEYNTDDNKNHNNPINNHRNDPINNPIKDSTKDSNKTPQKINYQPKNSLNRENKSSRNSSESDYEIKLSTELLSSKKRTECSDSDNLIENESCYKRELKSSKESNGSLKNSSTSKNKYNLKRIKNYRSPKKKSLNLAKKSHLKSGKFIKNKIPSNSFLQSSETESNIKRGIKKHGTTKHGITKHGTTKHGITKQRVFGNSIIKQINEMYNLKIEYNKALLKQMNKKASNFKQRMVQLLDCSIYSIK